MIIQPRWAGLGGALFRRNFTSSLLVSFGMGPDSINDNTRSVRLFLILGWEGATVTIYKNEGRSRSRDARGHSTGEIDN